MRRRMKRGRRRRKHKQRGRGQKSIKDELVDLAVKNLTNTAAVGINAGFRKVQRGIKGFFGKKKKAKTKPSVVVKPVVVKPTNELSQSRYRIV